MISCSAVIRMHNNIMPVTIKFLLTNRRRASRRKIRTLLTNCDQIIRVVGDIVASWLNIIGFGRS
jgi:hypothetical protein